MGRSTQRSRIAALGAALVSGGVALGLLARRALRTRPTSDAQTAPADSPVDAAAPPQDIDQRIAGLPPVVQTYILVFVVLTCLLLTFVIPPPYSAVPFGLLVLASLVVGASMLRRELRQNQSERRLFKGLLAARPALEIGLVIAAALFINWNFITSAADERVAGRELEWLTSSAHYAHLSLRDHGYLPLWQSYNEFGEPLIDNPFSFVLNPLSAGPTLIWGGVAGIKISAVLYGVFVGLGGLFLGWVLRLGRIPRLLLALLLVGKGNMIAMIGTGFFQLGVTQAYFPWIIGAGLLMLREADKRWPVVLLAIMFTLQFWAGNIWYTLPTGFALALLTIAQVLPLGRGTWDMTALRRMGLALLLTLGLSAISLLPIALNSGQIGRHTPVVEAGEVTDPLRVAQLFFDPSQSLFNERTAPYYPQFYYSFVVPLWFVLLLLALLPPIGPLRMFSRVGLPDSGRLTWIALVMLIGSFIWGVGGNPLMIWLYDAVPLLARWRFVGRALAVTSFWLAVLIVLRFDSLWKLALDPAWRAQNALPAHSLRWVQVNAALLLTVAGALGAWQVSEAARTYADVERRDVLDTGCLTWLRQQYPDRPLALWRYGYDVTMPFLDLRIRQLDIEADFAALPRPATLGQIDLTESPGEFAIAWTNKDGEFISPEGYVPVADSPRAGGRSCIWRHPNPLAYAYSIPLAALQTAQGDALDAALTRPLAQVERLPDRMRVLAAADPFQSLVVTVQERAYPGWRAWVDGQAAVLESVGGQVGVVLPPGGGQHDVVFEYRPPLVFVGGAITLITWALCIVYLLRGDQKLWRR